MIDSHSHIDADAFDDDRDQMLQRAMNDGIEFIVVPDIEPQRREKLKSIVDAYPFLVRGVGIHPHHAGAVTEAHLAEVDNQCTDPRRLNHRLSALNC